ncbi:hypothetical protein MKX01_026346, partial [Papaver californicum]
GFVISDWQGIDRITSPAGSNYTYSVHAGINIMVPLNHTDFINDLTYLVEKNVIPMSRIDDAVKRILRVNSPWVSLRILRMIPASLTISEARLVWFCVSVYEYGY